MENVATHLALFDLNQCIKVVVNHYCRQGVEDDISFIMVIIVEFILHDTYHVSPSKVLFHETIIQCEYILTFFIFIMENCLN